MPILLIFSLMFTSVGALQTPRSKPNFTGTWNARIVADPNAPVQVMRISYNDPRLEISRILIDRTPVVVMGRELKPKGSRDFVFFTDGRGETQKPVVPDLRMDLPRTTTQRVGEKFVTTERSTTKESGKEVTTDRIVSLEVSADGATLIETFSLVAQGNTSSDVRLYDRVSGATTRNINGEWKQRLSDQLISLTVEHEEPELKVTRRVVTEAEDETKISVYHTDGRGEINSIDGIPLKSVTRWKGKDLSFSSSNKSKGDGMTINTSESKKWTISEDGQSLIEITETKISMDHGYMLPPKPTKLIYARSSSPLQK